MLNSIKPICDWTVRLTASADERLACITKTSFHYTTSFMNPFLATMAQNWIIVNSLLTYTIIQYAVNSISRHQITDRLAWFWYNCKVLTCGAKERSLDCLAVTSAEVAVVDTSAGGPVYTDCISDWLIDVSSDRVVKTAHHYSRNKDIFISFQYNFLSC